MQSLLSQSESHAFQTFLSSMDYSEDTLSASEWALYNSAPMQHSIVDDSLDSNPEHRQALAKATKDLMSLDPDHRWDSGGDFMMNHQSNMNQRHFDPHGRHLGHYDQQLQHQQQLVHQQQVLQHQQQHLQQQQQQQQRANSYSSPHDSFPFLHNKLQQQQQILSLNPQYPQSGIPQQNLLSPLNMNHISPHDSSTIRKSHALLPIRAVDLLIRSDAAPTIDAIPDPLFFILITLYPHLPPSVRGRLPRHPSRAQQQQH
ncbi:hypothetical protein NLJ89_g3962 [Agrocybe chaxingu]|uniref:Uncharacterized protein n=1 Tax=Agrocybe chaxingu TaxID=84603 RepID=A0A9W8MWY4_9AGAR|nr:hypothetical protein NLJ89_g3962 [Agrocybe chaxingu]